MAQKDVVVIKKENPLEIGWKPITISLEAYTQIRVIAEETNMPISKVACKLLNFALKRVVIETEEI